MNKREFKKSIKTYTLEAEKSHFEVISINSASKSNKAIVFPLFTDDGITHRFDLLKPFVDRGYQVVIYKLASKGDRILFFNYFGKVFERLIIESISKKVIKGKEIIMLSFGVGALLATKLQKNRNKIVSKYLLVSPVNQYRDGTNVLGRELLDYKSPTYLFFGQFDGMVDIDSRFAMFEKAHNNSHVQYFSYPATSHFLFYEHKMSVDVEKAYKKIQSDIIVGNCEDTYLPIEAIYNQEFFEDIFNVIEDKPLKKKVALLSDVFPLFVNGVAVVVGLLKNELEKLGYKVYIVALWDKKEPLDNLPNGYIPVMSSSASLIKGHKDLHILKNLSFQKNAKQLSTFGFDYLHLHTEYSMGQIGLWLSRYSGVKMLYSYHTLWKLYYERKFGKLFGDFTYSAARDLVFSRVYKECPVITVPSLKSYEILISESKAKDIRIIPSSIDYDCFKISKDDIAYINKLKNQYGLKKKKVLGYIGRVSTEKNIVETLEYIARIKEEIPNIVFMIVGIGDALKALKKSIKKLNLEEYVIFVGEIEYDKLKYYYALFDVFVTASNFETQGLTYFEAASCGTLILAKEDKAIEGVFIDGYNAYLYKDFYQWAERIEKALFSNNRKLIEHAKKLSSQYAPDKWAKKISNIYLEINNKHK